MEIRARGAYRLDGLESQRCYRLVPAPVRPVRHDHVSSMHPPGETPLDAADKARRSSAVKGRW
jgi:hypothetical protein